MIFFIAENISVCPSLNFIVKNVAPYHLNIIRDAW